MFIKISHPQTEQIFLFSYQNASYDELKQFASYKFDIPANLIYFYYVYNQEEKALFNEQDLQKFKDSNIRKLYIQRQSEIIEIYNSDEEVDEEFQIHEKQEQEEKNKDEVEVQEEQEEQFEQKEEKQQRKQNKKYLRRLSELYENKWKQQLNKKKQQVEQNFNEFQQFYKKELPYTPAIGKVLIWNYRQIKKILEKRNENEL